MITLSLVNKLMKNLVKLFSTAPYWLSDTPSKQYHWPETAPLIVKLARKLAGSVSRVS